MFLFVCYVLSCVLFVYVCVFVCLLICELCVRVLGYCVYVVLWFVCVLCVCVCMCIRVSQVYLCVLFVSLFFRVSGLVRLSALCVCVLNYLSVHVSRVRCLSVVCVCVCVFG